MRILISNVKVKLWIFVLLKKNRMVIINRVVSEVMIVWLIVLLMVLLIIFFLEFFV